ncbi:MAG TPA: hypothetical protein VF897_26530, partial [Roseiflexaceae bacterium]
MSTADDTPTRGSARPRMAGRPLLLPGVEQLWAILALTVIGVFIALVPTPPHDFWWHLKAGEIVATQGIPTTNMFAWSVPADQPFVYATWLGEWLFYALYRAGGPQAPILARNLLGLAGFALIAADAKRRSGSWRLAALAALLAWLMAINNLPARTQNWAWVPFALFALVLGAYTAGQVRPRALLALPPLMAFWVNVHGSFALGLALMAIVAAGETVRALLGARATRMIRSADKAERADRPETNTAQSGGSALSADQDDRRSTKLPAAPGWDRLGWLYLAAAATAAATLLNPLGPGIFGYVAKLLTDPPSQGLVVEWQPPTTRGLAGFFFFASILALLAAFALARSRPTITDVLLVCAFLWLAWTGQRYVVWYGMLAMPILAGSLAQTRAPLDRRTQSPRMALPSTLIALTLLAALVAVQPPFKARLGLPAPYRALFADMPGAPELYSADTPVAAAAYLRAHPAEGRLFNEMGYGSYLDWALYPAAQVFVDPRIELYPLAIWQDYLAIRDARDYNAMLIDKYDVRRVLLDKVAMPRLTAALAADQRWQREYADAR